MRAHLGRRWATEFGKAAGVDERVDAQGVRKNRGARKAMTAVTADPNLLSWYEASARLSASTRSSMPAASLNLLALSCAR